MPYNWFISLIMWKLILTQFSKLFTPWERVHLISQMTVQWNGVAHVCGHVAMLLLLWSVTRSTKLASLIDCSLDDTETVFDDSHSPLFPHSPSVYRLQFLYIFITVLPHHLRNYLFLIIKGWCFCAFPRVSRCLCSADE